ncbi:MAG: hypothetical protein U0694_07745 [Anaerolineae bacterium]
MSSAEDKDNLTAVLRAVQRETLHLLEGADQTAAVEAQHSIKALLENLALWEAEILTTLQGSGSTEDDYAPYAVNDHLPVRESADHEAQRLYRAWEAVGELLRATIFDNASDCLAAVVPPWSGYAAVDQMISELVAFQHQPLETVLPTEDRRAS